ncbi:MAG: tetratricopeptide repeat protein, partial [Flavobacteriales bacterium]
MRSTLPRLHHHARAASLCALLLFLSLFAQAQFNVDSVQQLLAKTHDPVEHLKLLRQLSKASDHPKVQRTYAYATVHYADSLLAHGYAGDFTVRSLKGAGLWNLGDQHARRGMRDSALVWFEQAAALWKAIDDKEHIAFANSHIADQWIARGRPKEALEQLKQSLAVHEEMHDTFNLGRDHMVMGIAFYQLGDYSRALDHDFISLRFGQTKGMFEQMAVDLTNIGLIYQDQGQKDTAMVYYQRAIQCYKQVAHAYGSETPVNNLASILVDRGQNEDALKLCTEALAGLDPNGHADALCTLYAMIGMINRAMGELGQAVHFGELAVAAGEQAGIDRRVSALIQLGISLKEEHRYDQALKQALRAKELTDSLQISLGIRRQLAQLLSDIYTATGPAEKALQYYKEYEALKDSIGSDEMRKKLAHMDMRKQQLADSLRNEEETHRVAMVHQEEMNAEQNRKRGFMFGGIGVLLVAGGLWGRLRYTRRAKRAVEKERDRSDTLLLNILPSEIAEELKNTGGAVARDIDNVSILFTDFKGFTQMSEQVTAQE